jgi:hypothetical protein
MLSKLVHPLLVCGKEQIRGRPVLDLLGERRAGTVDEKNIAAAGPAVFLGNHVEDRLESDCGEYPDGLRRMRRCREQQYQPSEPGEAADHRDGAERTVKPCFSKSCAADGERRFVANAPASGFVEPATSAIG